MAAITFDTLKFANRLKKAGVSAQQAEAEARAEALSEVFETNLSEVTTKTDLAELKFEILTWFIGLAVPQFALLIGILIKLILFSNTH